MPEIGYIDPTAQERKSNFEPMPSGWYPAHLTEADIVPTKDGTGKRLPYKVEILEGPYAGRTVRMLNGINIVNRSAEAQRIGQEELRQLSEACGYAWPLPPNANSDIFLFKPLQVRLGLQKDKPEYNEVKAFRPYGAANAAPQPQPQTRPASADSSSQPEPQRQAAGAGGNRPWR